MSSVANYQLSNLRSNLGRQKNKKGLRVGYVGTIQAFSKTMFERGINPIFASKYIK